MRPLALALLLLAIGAPGAPGAHATLAPPDGLIAYERDGAIWTARPGDGRQERVIADGRNPSWSPDGRRLAFTNARAPFSVLVARANGSGRRLLAHDAASPDWSPDGRRLAFGDRTAAGGIGIVRFDGTGRTRLATSPPELAIDTDPAWSPDGERIAFVRRQSEARCDLEGCATIEVSASVYVIDADGGPERLLVSDAQQPDWRPDGERLLFSRFSRPRVATVRPDGSGVREPSFNGSGASWSPEGRRIVFTDDGRLFTADPDGAHRLPVDGARGTGAVWQPVGPQFQAVGSIRLRGPGRGRGRVIVFAAATGEVAFNLQARGLPRTGPKTSLGVWLAGGGPPRFLGFAPPVGQDGRLATSGPRESDADRFPTWLAKARRVLVTRETELAPQRPERVVLRGCVPCGG